MTTPEYIVFSLFILLGVIAGAAGIFNIEWFFTTDQTKFIIKHFGRMGARIIYGIEGLALIACGIAGLCFG